MFHIYASSMMSASRMDGFANQAGMHADSHVVAERPGLTRRLVSMLALAKSDRKAG